jgi:hypothetical protein
MVATPSVFVFNHGASLSTICIWSGFAIGRSPLSSVADLRASRSYPSRQLSLRSHRNYLSDLIETLAVVFSHAPSEPLQFAVLSPKAGAQRITLLLVVDGHLSQCLGYVFGYRFFIFERLSQACTSDA